MSSLAELAREGRGLNGESGVVVELSDAVPAVRIVNVYRSERADRELPVGARFFDFVGGAVTVDEARGVLVGEHREEEHAPRRFAPFRVQPEPQELGRITAGSRTNVSMRTTRTRSSVAAASERPQAEPTASRANPGPQAAEKRRGRAPRHGLRGQPQHGAGPRVPRLGPARRRRRGRVAAEDLAVGVMWPAEIGNSQWTQQMELALDLYRLQRARTRATKNYTPPLH